jgi:hypothetical protein
VLGTCCPWLENAVQQIQILSTATYVNSEVVHSNVLVIRLAWTGKSLERARADMSCEELMYGGAIFCGHDDKIDLKYRLMPSV